MNEIKPENKKSKILLFTTIFVVIFIISCTNTISIISGLIVYFLTLIFICLISIYTDIKLKSNFNKIALMIFITSLIAGICGFITFSFQEKSNNEKAGILINKIETFKKRNGFYPKEEHYIELPIARNGFYLEEFQYYSPQKEGESYIIKYFDGFWDYKVYVSNEKKWYIDD